MALARVNAPLVGLVVGSLLVAAYDATCYWQGAVPTSSFSAYWPFIFSILLALWIERDSRERPGVYRTFDFSFFVYMFSILYVPYYMWRTRGKKGVLVAVGIVALAFLGPLVVLAVDAAR